MKKKLSTLVFFSLIVLAANAQSWLLKGNTGIDLKKNFLGTTDLKPVIFRTNNVERMRINKNGSIGIGITNPGARFNVIVGGNVSLTTTDSFLLGPVSGLNLAFDNNEIQARNNGSSNTLYLNYWGGAVRIGNRNGASNPAVYANSTGQVGIGNTTTQAGFALTINPFATGGALYINDPGGGNLGLGTKSGNTGEGFRMNISSGSNPNAAIRGHTDGNGFGVLAEATGASGFGAEAYSSQSYGLWAGTGDGTTYAAFFSGDVFTSGDYQGSDEKLKQNIKDFSGAMDIINRLHPRQYEFRQDENYQLMNLPQGTHFGLIAQDVEKLLPTLVKETKFFTSKSNPSRSEELKNMPDIEFKALNYTELIPVIIKGMQEQQQTIEELRQQVSELKQMLAATNVTGAKSNTEINTAYLLQNSPNPVKGNATVRCYVPASVKQAQLLMYNMNGRLMRSFPLSNGMNDIAISTGSLSAGQYSYTLLTDGKKVDTRSMAITK
ncbi:MAG TPA: tail fiber domain-containing protein [Parafilimonas sp.]|nr:tail fiber domain-containing protein [Parafilimonas sp.]